MRDYSALSDFEINCAVGVAQGFVIATHRGDSGSMVGLAEKDGFTYNYYDYCNNPADAWPIILTNHIAITPYRHTLPCAWPTAFGITSKFYTEDANPLRAAMIVYLKMNSSE